MERYSKKTDRRIDEQRIEGLWCMFQSRGLWELDVQYTFLTHRAFKRETIRCEKGGKSRGKSLFREYLEKAFMYVLNIKSPNQL